MCLAYVTSSYRALNISCRAFSRLIHLRAGWSNVIASPYRIRTQSSQQAFWLIDRSIICESSLRLISYFRTHLVLALDIKTKERRAYDKDAQYSFVCLCNRVVRV